MKKSLMKKVFLVCAATLFAFALAACGIAKKPAETPPVDIIDEPTTTETTTTENKTDSVEGSYLARIDMTDYISEGAGVEISTPIFMEISMEIKSGDQYVINVDMEKFIQDSINFYKTDMPGVIKQTMIDQGVEESLLDAAVQSQGYQDFQDFVDQLLQQMIDELEAELGDSDTLISEGTFEIDGTTITLFESAGDGTIGTIGTVNSDGSFSFDIDVDGEMYDMTFEKK